MYFPMSLSMKNVPLTFQVPKTISKWFSSIIFKTIPVINGAVKVFPFTDFLNIYRQFYQYCLT